MFYVYQLSDPRDKAVFYVGKGKARRAWQHEIDAQRGRIVNQRKHERIIDILDAGDHVAVEIVAEYDNEQEAFDHEEELIAALSGLTNILASGGGWSLMREEAERRLEARKAKLAAAKHVRTVAWLKGWLEKVEKWPGVTFPNLKDGDAKAAEFVGMVRELVAQDA